MFIKKIFILFLALLLFVNLAACKKNDVESKTAVESKPEETENTFDFTPESKEIIVWLNGNSPDDPAVNAFIQDNPDFTVDNSTAITNALAVGWNKAYDLPRLAGAIASNDHPDLFWGYCTPMEAYYSNLFMPIHEFLLHDPDYNFETNEPNTFIPGTFNGKAYFFPSSLSTSILTWNKKLFEEVGLDPDKGPATWSEFQAYLEKLITYDSMGNMKTIGMAAPNFSHTTFWNVYSFGEHFTDETGLTLNYNTPSYKKMIEFERSIVDAFGGLSKLPAGIGFYSGNVGMGTSGATDLAFIIMFSNFEFSIARYPKPDDCQEDNIPLDYYNWLGIVKKARNPRGAWKFGKYLMTDVKYATELDKYQDDPNRYAPQYIPHIPTREKVYEEFLSYVSEDTKKMIEVRDEIMKKANIPIHGIAKQSEFYQYLDVEFNKFLNYEISSNDYLANAQTYGEALIKEFKETKLGERWTLNDKGLLIPPESEE